MRACVENTATQITWAATAALWFFCIGPECSAQIEQSGGRHLVVFIYNHCDHAIAPGEIELREIRDGGENAISIISTAGIARGESTWIYFPDALMQGERYRVIFHADCVNAPSKIVYRASKSFVFRYSENWRSLSIDRDDVRDRGDLVRIEFGKGPGAPDVIFAKPGDLIEIDYIFQGVQTSVEPKGGSHSEVVDLSPIGLRHIVVNAKTVGIATFFEAKSRGDDWISIEVNGVTRNFHVFVRAK